MTDGISKTRTFGFFQLTSVQTVGGLVRTRIIMAVSVMNLLHRNEHAQLFVELIGMQHQIVPLLITPTPRADELISPGPPSHEL